MFNLKICYVFFPPALFFFLTCACAWRLEQTCWNISCHCAFFFLYNHTKVSGLCYKKKVFYMKIVSVLVLIAILGNTFCKLFPIELSADSVVREGPVIYIFFSPCTLSNYYTVLQVCLVWLWKSLCTEKDSWMLCVKLLLLRSLCHRKNVKSNFSVHFASRHFFKRVWDFLWVYIRDGQIQTLAF